jgi:hypothetical protein
MADGEWKTWTCFREHPCLDLMRSPPSSTPLPGDAVCYKRNSTDGSWILWGLQVVSSSAPSLSGPSAHRRFALNSQPLFPAPVSTALLPGVKNINICPPRLLSEGLWHAFDRNLNGSNNWSQGCGRALLCAVALCKRINTQP